MTTETEYFEHSFEVQEIIGRTPSWTTRWGITALLITLLILILMSIVIKLPLVQHYSVNFKSTVQPFYVLNRKNVTLSTILSQKKVRVGEILASNKYTGYVITSPFDGTVSPWELNEVNSNDTLLVVNPKSSSYVAEGKVPIKILRFLHEGSIVNFTVSSDNIDQELQLSGSVYMIIPVATNQEVTFYAKLNKKSNQILRSETLSTRVIKGMMNINYSNLSIMQLLLHGNNIL